MYSHACIITIYIYCMQLVHVAIWLVGQEYIYIAMYVVSS